MNAAIPLACPLAWLDQRRGTLGRAAWGEIREGTLLLICSMFSSHLGRGVQP
jgi:hypothetical protein